MMKTMHMMRMPGTLEQRAGREADALGWVAPGLLSTALALFIWALCDWVVGNGLWLSWPVVASGVLMCLALFTEPLARRVGHRPAAELAQPAATFTALLMLSYGLIDPHPPSRLLWVVALLLSLVLAAGPLGHRLVRDRTDQDLALPIAALAALLVFLWALATDGYSYLTASPSTRFINNDIHVATVRVVIALLAVVLVTATLERSRPAYRLLIPIVATAALTVLVVTLVSARLMWPQYPYLWAIAILGFALAVGPLAQLFGVAPAQVLAKRVDDLSRTRSGALDVQANELRRIERDLHDGAQVRLVALSMKLGRAEDFYRDDPKTAALLREAREDATEAIRELRELARGIATPVLVKRGLDAAVRSLAQRSGLEVTVDGTLTERLALVVETAAYFVVGESLANAAKHAPGARVEIRLDERGGDLFVEITDFGPGGADPQGSGLTGLRQRVEALDGVLRVTSPVGVGTQVEAVIPCGR